MRWLHAVDVRVAEHWPGKDRSIDVLSDEPEPVRSRWRELPRSERDRLQTAASVGDIESVPAGFRLPLLRSHEARMLRLMRIVGGVQLVLLLPTLILMGAGEPGVAAAFALPGLAMGTGAALSLTHRLADLRKRRRTASVALDRSG